MSYWEDRQSETLESILNKAEIASDEISNVYAKSSIYINEKIQGIFDRYRAKYNLGIQEAKILLNSLDDSTSYDEMLRMLKRAKGEERQELLKKLESPAYRYRINRLQEMQQAIDDLMVNIYNQEKEISTNHYIDTAHDAYYKTIYNLQKGTGQEFSFVNLNEKHVNSILSNKWSGENYSQRIWDNTQNLADELKENLLMGILTGKTEKEMTEALTERFQVSNYKARRLVETESAYISTMMDLEAYKEAGVDTMRFCAIHDLKTSKICQNHDGKYVKMDKAVVGSNVPPLHPHCRSFMTPVIDEEFDRNKKRRIKNQNTGEYEIVDANETYREWYERVVHNNSFDESDEFFKNITNKAKSTLSGDKIVSYNELPDDIKEDFINGLNKSDILTKKLLESIYEKVSYSYDTKYQKSLASGLVNIIYLNKNNPSTMAHELYHIIDYKYKITKNSVLKSKIDRDYANLLNASNNNIKNYLLTKYPDAFTKGSGFITIKEEYKGISDIINGLSQGNLHFGYKHSKKYWLSKPNRYVKEAWAQFGRIGYEANSEVVNMLIDLFPEFVDEAVKISKRIGK